jgi:hypothetical protein
MGFAAGKFDSGRVVAALPRKKVELTNMHNAMVSLLFLVIAMFPCFLAASTSE